MHLLLLSLHFDLIDPVSDLEFGLVVVLIIIVDLLHTQNDLFVVAESLRQLSASQLNSFKFQRGMDLILNGLLH